MSEGGFVAILIAIAATLWLAAGTFLAWLFGVSGSVTYVLFVAAWPLPLVLLLLLAAVALRATVAILRAVFS